MGVWVCVCRYVWVFVAVWISSLSVVFFFQAEDGIRDLVRSRGLGDVYKRQIEQTAVDDPVAGHPAAV